MHVETEIESVRDDFRSGFHGRANRCGLHLFGWIPGIHRVNSTRQTQLEQHLKTFMAFLEFQPGLCHSDFTRLLRIFRSLRCKQKSDSHLQEAKKFHEFDSTWLDSLNSPISAPTVSLHSVAFSILTLQNQNKKREILPKISFLFAIFLLFSLIRGKVFVVFCVERFGAWKYFFCARLSLSLSSCLPALPLKMFINDFTLRSFSI